jgi:hypothetical protein
VGLTKQRKEHKLTDENPDIITQPDGYIEIYPDGGCIVDGEVLETTMQRDILLELAEHANSCEDFRHAVTSWENEEETL